MKQNELVGISTFSRRKIYHKLTATKGLPIHIRAACVPYAPSFIYEIMTVREAEKKGYRLCKHCKRKMEREK